jgi:hypothetical protein
MEPGDGLGYRREESPERRPPLPFSHTAAHTQRVIEREKRSIIFFL